MKIIKEEISIDELKAMTQRMFGNLVKAVSTPPGWVRLTPRGLFQFRKWKPVFGNGAVL